MLNFLCFFVLFIAVEIDKKLTLHHMGRIFIIWLTKIKFTSSPKGNDRSPESNVPM